MVIVKISLDVALAHMCICREFVYTLSPSPHTSHSSWYALVGTITHHPAAV